MHELLHQEMGIDSFALDGDDTAVADPWQDRPARAKSAQPAHGGTPAAAAASHADSSVDVARRQPRA